MAPPEGAFGAVHEDRDRLVGVSILSSHVRPPLRRLAEERLGVISHGVACFCCVSAWWTYVCRKAYKGAVCPRPSPVSLSATYSSSPPGSRLSPALHLPLRRLALRLCYRYSSLASPTHYPLLLNLLPETTMHFTPAYLALVTAAIAATGAQARYVM